MRGHRKLKEAALACGIALSLAQQVAPAAAFSVEPAAPPSANVQNSPAQLGQPGVPQMELNDPLSMPKPKDMELTIPGFGTVATIPKMDFGLELLYGPKNGPDALQLDQHSPDAGDMQIKGTLTRRF